MLPSLYKPYKTRLVRWICLLIAIALYSCANRGTGPQGGPKDETPPVVVETHPANRSTNVAEKQLSLVFNELISVENPSENVVFSPPAKEQPTVKAIGKKLNITYHDSLQPNTTYTIDFGCALADYNEKNLLRDYRYTFSTGSSLDTLQASGWVVDARTLKPIKGLTVGIYSHTEADSAIFKKPFERIARTDSSGHFNLIGLHEGTYRIYAIQDASKQAYYTQKGNYVAFGDSLITPDVHLHGTIDTLWNQTHTSYDSLLVDAKPHYYPDDILLKAFCEQSTYHHFKRAYRKQRDCFSLAFSAKPPQQPQIELLNGNNQQWLLAEKGLRADSLTYWITDSLIYKQDSVRIRLSYLQTDSLGQLQAQTDTVNLLFKDRGDGKKSKNKRKAGPPVNEQLMQLSYNLSNTMEAYDTLRISFPQPVAHCLRDSIHLLWQENDSTWTPVPFNLKADDSACVLNLNLHFQKNYGQTYRVRVDSAACQSIYGKVNEVFYKTFTLNKLEEYANLYVRFPQAPPGAVVELLDKDEKCVATGFYENGEYGFQDIKPGTYCLRLFLDSNGNGVWDTGKVTEKQQAETVFYYPKWLVLRANWDMEEEWPYNTIDWLQQRPAPLSK